MCRQISGFCAPHKTQLPPRCAPAHNCDSDRSVTNPLDRQIESRQDRKHGFDRHKAGMCLQMGHLSWHRSHPDTNYAVGQWWTLAKEHLFPPGIHRDGFINKQFHARISCQLIQINLHVARGVQSGEGTWQHPAVSGRRGTAKSMSDWYLQSAAASTFAQCADSCARHRLGEFVDLPTARENLTGDASPHIQQTSN